MPNRAKKRVSSRRGAEDDKKGSHNEVIAPVSQTLKQRREETDKHKLNTQVGEDVRSSSSVKYGRHQMYDKSISSNEPNENTLQDKLRGKTFDDVVSEIGVNGYFQLKEEKEWENLNEMKELCMIETDDLVSSLKGIPLHVVLNVSEEYFMPEMIHKFEKQASRGHELISRKVKEKEIVNTFSPKENLIIKENLPSKNASYLGSKPVVLSAKTESLINSLTSCLSLKDKKSDTIKEVNIVDDNVSNPQHNTKVEDNNDDLTYLLSLSIPSVSTPSVVHSDNVNIDDWLSKLLEDKNE